MKKLLFPLLALPFLMASCIGDDIIMDRVDEAVRITNSLDT